VKIKLRTAIIKINKIIKYKRHTSVTQDTADLNGSQTSRTLAHEETHAMDYTVSNTSDKMTIMQRTELK
jgi:hypothetical protein